MPSRFGARANSCSQSFEGVARSLRMVDSSRPYRKLHPFEFGSHRGVRRLVVLEHPIGLRRHLTQRRRFAHRDSNDGPAGCATSSMLPPADSRPNSGTSWRGCRESQVTVRQLSHSSQHARDEVANLMQRDVQRYRYRYSRIGRLPLGPHRHNQTLGLARLTLQTTIRLTATTSDPTTNAMVVTTPPKPENTVVRPNAATGVRFTDLHSTLMTRSPLW